MTHSGWRPSVVLGAGIICLLLAQPGWAEEPSATHVFENWAVLFDAGDVDGVVAAFSDDVVFSNPGPRGLIIGKDALRFFTAELFDGFDADGSSLEVEHEQVSGSWANVVATFTTTWTDLEEGKKSTERSRYVCVLKRASNGEWGIWRFTFFPVSD